MSAKGSKNKQEEQQQKKQKKQKEQASSMSVFLGPKIALQVITTKDI